MFVNNETRQRGNTEKEIDDAEKDIEEDEFEIDTKKNTKGKNERERSPFEHYFKKKIATYSELLKVENNNNFYAPNKYFSPALFEIIRDELYKIPLWSGIMIQHKNIGKRTRLSNNYVENWFGQLKNNILKNNIVGILPNLI